MEFKIYNIAVITSYAGRCIEKKCMNIKIVKMSDVLSEMYVHKNTKIVKLRDILSEMYVHKKSSWQENEFYVYWFFYRN